MYKSLSEFLSRLEHAGEVKRISVPVDPSLEIAEITDRVVKSEEGGPALLFENTGTDFPLAINLFGSEKRMAMALGQQSLEEIPRRIDALLNETFAPKTHWADKLRMLTLLGHASEWLPRHKSGRGSCQEVVWQGEEARLSRLPILKCWPRDGGRFITLPLVHTVDPASGSRNVGMYRMQIRDDHTACMHWQLHKTGARHYEAWKRSGQKRMPVSVCLGGDPVYTYAATAPMPEGMDEYLLAGFLREKPVRLVRCMTNELFVPEECDFVLEGYVDTEEEMATEGPFGDHTGFYSLEERYPLFHLTAITHRRDAIYPATIVGIPPQEDAWITRATEKIFLSPLRALIQPEIEALWMPEAGTAHNLAVVAIRRDYAGQPEKVAGALWGAGQMMFNKYLIVVPEGTDIRDTDALALQLRRVRPQRDLHFATGVLDILDHATATPGYGGKLLIDATGSESEGQVTLLPERFQAAGGFSTADDSLVETWGVLILRCELDAEPNVETFLAANEIKGIACVALFDSATRDLTSGELLWIALANTDPRRDLRLANGILIADCRSKTGGKPGFPTRFPNVVVSDEATIERVDRRWHEYGFEERLLSPSLRYNKLLRTDKAEA